MNKTCIVEGFVNPNKVVNELQDLIESKYKDLFHAVLAHGSVATNEVIRYSDFDGLLIVKDEFVNSKQLKSFKNESMKVIYNFDPLQHHGWFQIRKSDLINYPEHYLPVTTLNHAKLIYPNAQSISLNLIIQINVDYKRTLINMLNQFERRDAANWRPNNMFQLKSVLSQVMLIPCLYFSALHNDGIFKRESFEAVKSEFSELEWSSIACATNIRANWDYSLNSTQKWLLSLTGRIPRKVATRFFTPRIPLKLQQKLNEEFYDNIKVLVKKIKEDIV